jgi:dsRNA-specific ribonuclease
MFPRSFLSMRPALSVLVRASSAARRIAGFGAQTFRASLSSRAAADLGLPRCDDPAALEIYRSCLSSDESRKRHAFLGDAVLYLVATRAAFQIGADAGSLEEAAGPDGPRDSRSSPISRCLTAAEMHRARLPVIGNKHLAARGRAIGVDDLVIAASRLAPAATCRGPIAFSWGPTGNDGRVADAVEALVGASFAVGGLEAADSFIRRSIMPTEYPPGGRG